MEPMDYDRPEGASPVPPQPLVAHVSNHVLTGGDVEALLEALHSNPDEVDRAALYKDDPKRPGPVAGLEYYARQLAKLVSGGTIKRGAPPAAEPRAGHKLSEHIKKRRRAGATDEEILADLYAGAIWPPSIPSLTLDEIKRLGRLELPE